MIAATWRRALVAALMLLVSVAPVASAACDLDDIASHRGGAGPVHTLVPHAPLPHDDDGACCAHEPEVFAVQAKLPAADGELAGLSVGITVLVAGRAPGLRIAHAGPTVRQRSSAPPEPTFRRVPRLLL